MEPVWLKEMLLGGQTANGFRIGTAIFRGWFWARVKGCRLVYRGGSMETIDFDRILAVTDADASEISLPSYLAHEPGQVYFYVVRCSNGCGRIERTLQAAVKIGIDGNGEMQEPRPNGVFGLSGGQQQDGNIEIIWQYSPIGQESPPEKMMIYSDGGTGEIDYQEPMATVQYNGRKFYRFQVSPADDGRYQFVVRAADARGNEHSDMRKIEVEVRNKDVESIEIVGMSGI
jgi:hypothetical protein